MVGAEALVVQTVENEASFWTCPRTDVVRAMAHMEVRTLADGETLYRRGDNVDHTYLVISGTLTVANRPGETAELDRGFLGEEALIGMTCYLGSATAKGTVEILAIPIAVGNELSQHEEFRSTLVESLNQRILQQDRAETYKRPVLDQTGSWRMFTGWLLAGIVPLLLVYFFSDADDSGDPRQLYLFAVLSCIVILWMFNVVIDYIPSILALLAFILYGIAPTEVVLSGFSSPTFFMAMSVFGLAAVIVMSGLGFRMLLWLLRVGPPHPIWQFMALFLSGALLTPVIPTASGRMAVVGPFISDLLYGLSDEEKHSVAPRLAAAILWGVSLFTTIFLSASPLNFLVYGLLPEQEQLHFQWLDWFIAASVCGAVLMVLFLAVSYVFFRKGKRGIDLSPVMLKEQTRLIGPLRPIEIGALGGLFVLALAFMTNSIHKVEIPWIAMAILFGLLMFGAIDRFDFRRRIDWGFLLNLGAAIGIVETMQYLHLDAVIASQLGWLAQLMKDDFTHFLLLLSVVVFLIRLIMPTDAVVLILCSVFMPTAAHVGANPWVVGFVILLIAEGFIWPYQADFYSQFCVISDEDLNVEGPRNLLLNLAVFFIKLVAIYATLGFWAHLGLV